MIVQRQQQSKIEGTDVLVMEAALLLEAGWDRLVDEVWCVCVSPRTQVERVMERNGLSADEAGARVAAQMTTAERISRSHVVLCSQWEKETTAAQARLALTQALKRRASTHTMSPGGGRGPLRERWAQLVRGLAVDGDAQQVDALTRAWWRRLYDLHCQPHRYHHSLDRLQNILGCQERLQRQDALQCPDAFALATFFHNAVYTATRTDNEERSEKLFHAFCADLRNTAPSVTLDATRVSESILRTADGSYNADLDVMSDTAAFLDRALGVMGATPSGYARYCEGLRLEHAHSDDEQYRVMRVKGLRDRFGDRNVYITPHFGHFEDDARSNIESEIVHHKRAV